METQFVYQKKRSEFGRQCLFSDRGPELIVNLPTDKKVMNHWILQDPVDRGTLYAPIQAQHEVNTTSASYKNTAMNHVEGGWPKDVNIYDEEQTKRYRRKIEKEDSYAPAVLQLCRSMEFNILQNNTINIYEQYFDDLPACPIIEKTQARTVYVFKDQSTPTRPVNFISWSPDNQTKIAVSHCNLKYQNEIPDQTNFCYIWEIENPNFPLTVLKPPEQTLCMEYHQKDHNCLVSGQYNGQVALWDLRKGCEPIDVSLMEESFRDPVHNVLWINSKSGCEFFSSSTDGQVKWWDIRKLQTPIDCLLLDITKEQNFSKALGASVLEYDSSIPTRFMVGTEEGIVISCNRKGKTPQEIMTAKYSAHFGPVLALQRNPAFPKNFLTVGDWCVRIFSEDCKESPIIWTPFHEVYLTSGAWTPARPSVFFITRSDGKLDVWDILQDQKQACLSVKISDERLTCLRMNEQGRHLAVGNQAGNVYLINLSENLAFCSKTDKALLTAMFEREAKREKILEARNRELRLKLKVKSAMLEETVETDEAEIVDMETDGWTTKEIKLVEQDYMNAIRPQPLEEDFDLEEEETEQELDLEALKALEEPSSAKSSPKSGKSKKKKDEKKAKKKDEKPEKKKDEKKKDEKKKGEKKKDEKKKDEKKKDEKKKDEKKKDEKHEKKKKK